MTEQHLSPEIKSIRRSKRRRHESLQPTIGNYGVSVFREVDRNDLNSVLSVARTALSDLFVQMRGGFQERPPAITLVELKEMKRQRSIAKVAIKDVIDQIYQDVPSVRRGIGVTPTGIELLGRDTQTGRTIALVFSEEDEERLSNERSQILQTVEEFSPDQNGRFSWYSDKRPHISLARIPTEYVGSLGQDATDYILSHVPEVIRAKRAIIHNPSRRYT